MPGAAVFCHRLLHRSRGQCRRFDDAPVGAGGDGKLAAQLAIDLEHELDLVLNEGGGVDFRPWRIDDVAELGRVAQLLP